MSRMNRKQRKRAFERQRQLRRAERRGSASDVASTALSGPSARSIADPICGVASPTIDPSLCWYIARTKPRMGDRALKALQDAKAVTYQPRTSEVVVRRGRRVVRHAAMLTRTVFIGVEDAAHLDLAKGAVGIAEIVCRPEEDKSTQGNIAGPVLKPARLDAAGLQLFVDAIANGEIVEPVGVKAGQSVVVLSGPFASFPAVVEEVLPHNRIKVGVSIFGRASPVELDIAEVRAI